MHPSCWYCIVFENNKMVQTSPSKHKSSFVSFIWVDILTFGQYSTLSTFHRWKHYTLHQHSIFWWCFKFPSGNLRYTLRRDEDVSRRSFVLVPCAVFGLIWCFGRSNIHFGALEYFWTFSIMLEPVAMIPQLLIVHRKRCNLDKGIQFYCLFQFLSRFFYILNWIYRSWTEPHFFYPFIYYIGGFVHCLLIALPWIWKKLNMDPFHLLESVPKATNDDGIEEELSFIYHLIVDTDTGNGV